MNYLARMGQKVGFADPGDGVFITISSSLADLGGGGVTGVATLSPFQISKIKQSKK